MASMKKPTGTKKRTGKKAVQVRDLPERKKRMSPEQAGAVKGGYGVTSSGDSQPTDTITFRH